MTELSSATTAVYEAFGRAPLRYEYVSHDMMHGALPAALRAAADQVAPCEECPVRPLNSNALEMRQFQDRFSRWHQASLIQQQIYAIANELEAHQLP